MSGPHNPSISSDNGSGCSSGKSFSNINTGSGSGNGCGSGCGGVPSRVVPGLLSPRPGTDDMPGMQPFQFLEFSPRDHEHEHEHNHGHDTDLDSDIGIIERSDSGPDGGSVCSLISNGSGGGGSGSGSGSVSGYRSRKRSRPEAFSESDISNGNHPVDDHFRHEIQEQIPHLQVAVAQRKRSSSISSSSNGKSPEESKSTNHRADEQKESVVQQVVSIPESTLNILRSSKSQHQTGPKRPRTAYIIFLEKFRQQYYEMFPNANFNDCQKFAGKKWRSLTDEEKRPWKEQERKSQKDFIHKMHGLQNSFGLLSNANISSSSLSSSDDHSFQTSNPHQNEGQCREAQQRPDGKGDKFYQHANEGHSMNKLSSDVHSCGSSIAVHQNQMKMILNATHPNKMNDIMKGPKNAFSIYVQSMRKECQRKEPNLTYNEIQKRLSVEWRQMSHKDKAVWIEKSNEVKKQLSIYNEEMAAQGVDHTQAKKGDMRKAKKGIALPKGPRSAYTLFYQCARKQLHEARPELSFQEYPTICSKIWREMPENEKMLWKNDSINDKIRYEQELLALARSDVANTATSIVMEEKMSEMKSRLKPDEINSILASHSAGSTSRSTSASSSLSSSTATTVSSYGVLSNHNDDHSANEIDHPSKPEQKNKRGKYKKKNQPAAEVHLNSTFSNGARDREVSDDHLTVRNLIQSSDFFERNHAIGSVDFPPNAADDHKFDAWMDIAYDHDPSHTHDDVAHAELEIEALTAYSRDSLDQNGGSPVPMVGVEKSNMPVKSPVHHSTARDFEAAGMTSKMGDSEDDTNLHKSFSSISPHASSEKEVQHDGHVLYNGIHHNSLSSDSHDMMSFTPFDDFRQV